MPLRKSRMATGAGHDLHVNSEKRSALDDLFSATYEELRRLAFSVKRGDPGQTLAAWTYFSDTCFRADNQRS
jgi:hypothetical protein